MKVQGTMLVLGAKRRTWTPEEGGAARTFCDVYVGAEQTQGADAVGMQSDRFRMEPKLVDSLRHVQLPATMAYAGELEKFGDKMVLTITDLQTVKARAA